ncbi:MULTISPECIES: DedA family protein [unclassified Mycobacterium]|uniref:DedA family protein n=1 Tax=unclassified Mycobacterium TaxID=2642494 RepID=UPI000F9A937D|nr:MULTISPECIES: DedA family protein [unclassified Mycobacterium]MDP7702656.1 DedA family protein [Mycobacterium sp. TY815]MDP7721149.1 DedA family protein [Mycobacterium sp. TY814]RUP03009.1 MAG: DedA family protein [Mycobacterium sp.]
MDLDALLHSIPPLAVYLLVGGVVGVESLGIPLPGEIVLVSAALMSSHHEIGVNPIGVGAAAVIGAVVGDSIGYSIGRRFGMPLFDRLGRRFPKHFGPGHVALAERTFERWGVRAVFFGRFIALLRIFAGPLAGALKMPYPRFLAANVSGGICWAGGTTALVYYAGVAAERWMSRFSWVALVIAVVCGVTAAILLRERTSRAIAELEEEHYRKTGTPAPEKAA